MKNQAQNAEIADSESLNLKNAHSSMKNEAQDAENADGESLNLKNTHSSIKNEAQIAENGDGESLNLKNAHSSMKNEAQNADGESLNLKNTHSSTKNQAQIAENAENGEGESLTLKNAHSSMKNQVQNTENAENGEGESLSLQDLSFNANVSISMCSSSSSSNISNNTNKNADSEQSESTSLSYASNSNSFDANELSFRSICLSKPHKGNDVRWDAIQCVNSKDGDLGLGHFRLLKKLGCGDIGSVYLAELRGMGCLFALKVMDKGMLAGRKKLMRAQTEREILGLLDHPFLPTLYSHFETEKFSCLLMEFCSGGDLHMLRQRQPGKHFTEQAARFYASEVLLALEYLHMMGVVYRDLKPENVLVREDGHIMLSDFDLSLRCFVNPTLVQSSTEPSCRISSYCIQPSCIEPACKLPVCVEPACLQPSCFKPRFLIGKTAKVKTERTTSTNSDSLPVLIAEPTSARSMSFVGTHEYLAPEIIRGDGHGSAVDWWTFGIFLYELLCGRTPFKGNGNRETLFNVVGQSLKFPEGCSASFAAKDLIRGLLVKDPQKRLGFKRGATEIKQHPFFESINWALIRGTHPPEIPKPVDLAILDQKFKPSAPPNDKGAAATDSDRSSGPYLDFEFF